MTYRSMAWDKLSKLRQENVSDTAILDYIIGNYLSGDQANEVMDSCGEEFDVRLSDEEEEVAEVADDDSSDDEYKELLDELRQLDLAEQERDLTEEESARYQEIHKQLPFGYKL
jgi:hypothetical protein